MGGAPARVQGPIPFSFYAGEPFRFPGGAEWRPGGS